MTHPTRTVIVGGGIVGAAVAYHLTVVHGWRDLVLIDKGPLPYNIGSTSHAPGGVVAVSHSKLLTQMANYSSDLYATLDDYDDAHRVFTRVGGIELARTTERFEDLKRLHGECKAWGVATHLLSPAEVQHHFPFVDPTPVSGGLFADNSALVRGYHVVGDLLRRAEATGGLVWHEMTSLNQVESADGSVTAVVTDNPEVERIECDAVVIAANIWSPALARQFGLRIPLMAFEHQYAITSPLPEFASFDRNDIDAEVSFPLLRDVDVALYYRKHWDQLGIGSYHHTPRSVRSEDVGDSAMRAFTSEDFTTAEKLAGELIPMLRNGPIEYETSYNGMFAFSVDGMPIIGESRLIAGLWSANAAWITHAGGVAKSVAEWMTSGETEWDMRACHLYRFPEHALTDGYLNAVSPKNYRELYDIVHPRQPLTEPRNVRMSPFHMRHAAADVVYTTFAGFELPNWYESNAALVDRYRDEIPERGGWAGAFASPIQGAEHLAMRDRVGLMDLTGLSIIEVNGPGALAFLERLCANRIDVAPGRVVYTCWLTPSGGIKRDLTVARLDATTFWLFVGEGTLPMDLDWVLRHVPDDVAVVDRSASYSALGLWGPFARDVLAEIATADLSNEAFPYYTGQWIDVGMANVYAMRMSYVGELGWELHIPVDSSLSVWDAIVTAGKEYGLVLCGLGAMDSMRLEKGYRLWGGDIHTEYNVAQARLAWTTKIDKGDFIGRDATAKIVAAGPSTMLACLAIDDPRAALTGYEAVFHDGEPVAHTTTSNWGYSVGRQIAFAYLPLELTTPGTELTVEYFGEAFPAQVVDDPLWDPAMKRMRA